MLIVIFERKAIDDSDIENVASVNRRLEGAAYNYSDMRLRQ